MPDADHYEQQYLDLMRRIWAEGHERVDRTGVGTRALFGATMRFSLADDAVPLLTTKRVYWKAAAREMLWFLTGNTNIRPLVEQGVHIWTDWPLDKYRKATGEVISRDDFEARIVADEAFALQWGDLGPVYGAQWVNWPRYEPAGPAGAGGEGLYRRARQGHNQIAAQMARVTGLEPATSGVTGRRSNQLSYTRVSPATKAARRARAERRSADLSDESVNRSPGTEMSFRSDGADKRGFEHRGSAYSNST
jgi:hypothetical protein